MAAPSSAARRAAAAAGRRLALLGAALLAALAAALAPAAAAQAEDPLPPARHDVGLILPVVLPASVTGLPSATALANAVAPGGPLDQALAVARSWPVTLAIDPEIVAAIRALGSSAPLATSDWLAQLAALQRPAFLLPFAAADPGAQAALGLSSPLQPTSLAFATEDENFGAATTAPDVAQLTAWPGSLSPLIVPASSSLNAEVLGRLQQRGTVLLDSGALEGAGAEPLAMVNGQEALISDARLAGPLASALAANDDGAWSAAMSQVSGALAAPAAHGSLVMLDPAAVAGSTRLSSTITALHDAGAVFVDALSLPRNAAAAAVAPSATLRDGLLDQDRLNALSAALGLEGRVDEFAQILAEPSLLSGLQRVRLLGLFSLTLADGPPAAFAKAADQYTGSSTRTLGAVRLADPVPVLPFSYESTLPVQVVNELDWPVTVTVSAVPENNRLLLPEPDQTITVQPGSSGTAAVPMQAKVGTGDVDVLVTLYAQNGERIGETVSIPVSVHADWESIGMAVIGALVALFIGFGAWRSIRNRRARRATAGERTPQGGSSGDG